MHRLLAPAVQERGQQHLRQEDDDEQRRERPERVHEVGLGEVEAAAERGLEAQPLVDDRRHGEAERRQPEEAGEHRQRDETGGERKRGRGSVAGGIVPRTRTQAPTNDADASTTQATTTAISARWKPV